MTSVLIVDDSAVDRALVGELLGKEPQWKIEHAENGAEALARMKESRPDVVVTDLQMPKMDGLEFVTAARDLHFGVPVILMTAHGSESLALEALERGAASYVPKSQLIDTLLASVKQVLSLARADRSHKRLIECLTSTQFTFFLENDLSLIEALVDLMQGIVDGVQLCDPLGRIRVGMALEQALHNAIYWGNLEITLDDIEEAREQLLMGRNLDLVEQRRTKMPYCERRVRVHARIGPEEACFVVRDEGRGFNVPAGPGSNHPGDLEKGGGRGLVLMRAFMDEVTYNDAGNEVTMIKRRDRAVVKAESPDCCPTQAE
ncbi:MAG: response regulator [Thermoguttaceae bacterium]|jgi:CheY-like chemotaxis protein